MNASVSPLLLSEQQCSIIVTETEHLIEATHQHYSLRPRPVTVSLNVKGRAWGYFVQKGSDYFIRYNPFLFARYFNDGIKDTVPHEVAHYAVARLNPRRRYRPHGVEWQNVMNLFGVENPRATHRSDLSGIPCRRQRRFSYACACGEVELSTTRHYRIQCENVKYLCRKCGEHLREA